MKTFLNFFKDIYFEICLYELYEVNNLIYYEQIGEKGQLMLLQLNLLI